MLLEFFDAAGVSDHNRFQEWRTHYQDGVFLSLQSKSRATLHGARCVHLGSGPPYFTTADLPHSLTAKKKLCGPEPELRTWAAKNQIKIANCQHCVRDDLIGFSGPQGIDRPPPPEIVSTTSSATDDVDLAEELIGLEGAPLRRLTLHRHRERKLRAAKVALALKEGSLKCEVPGCGFDFERTYGSVGRGYAQVHHLQALADREDDSPTPLSALAIVCANCHAMIHRGGENRDPKTLLSERTRVQSPNSALQRTAEEVRR